MLFDLRSRGRRRTVQVVYLGLAVLIGGGLILFGVGTGSGTGGLLNAFTGNGSGNAQSQAISQQEKNADKQVKVNPNNAAAWGELVNARWTDAATGTNYNSTTGAFSADGKKELAGTTARTATSVTTPPRPTPGRSCPLRTRARPTASSASRRPHTPPTRRARATWHSARRSR
jgi:hypothetical protein